MLLKDENPYKIFGLEPSFQIDLDQLDRAYFSQQSLMHPDKFINHSEPERQIISSKSSIINRAYAALKDPILRAKTLMKLNNIPIPGETAEGSEERPKHHPEILSEMMDLNEAVSEAISPHDLDRVEGQIMAQLDQTQTSFSDNLLKNSNQDLPEIYLRMTYFSKLVLEIKTRRRQLSIKTL